MNASHSNKKKYKKPKQKTFLTTNPEASVLFILLSLVICKINFIENDAWQQFLCKLQSSRHTGDSNVNDAVEPLVPLLAKDSEWVDILQTPAKTTPSISNEEEVLQLVECEDGPEMKPLAIMFPGLLEKDPQTLEGMLTKAMSTTEVTKHLVDLGQKANFKFMKKANRLIPPDKNWLGSVSENSDSYSSVGSGVLGGSSNDEDDHGTREAYKE